jgi:hypothetical protein
MQFQVPQFIETEDKIVGPLSMRQFIYVAIAGGLSAMLYFSVGGFVWIFGSIIIFALAGALCFIKIEGRPFLDVMLAAANFYWKPQMYVWQPEHPTVRMAKKRAVPHEPFKEAVANATKQKLAASSALHKTLAELQTGERGRESDKQYLEHQMETRYQIFRKETGDRRAARRVDYR